MNRRIATLVGVLGLALCFYALGGTSHASGENAPGAKQVIDTADVMKLLVDPSLEDMKDAMVKEPLQRKQWRAIYIPASRLAEYNNLLFSREGEDEIEEEYLRSPEWAEMAVEAREITAALRQASKDKDWRGVQAAYGAMIESCNACHEKFQTEEPTVVEP